MPQLQNKIKSVFILLFILIVIFSIKIFPERKVIKDNNQADLEVVLTNKTEALPKIDNASQKTSTKKAEEKIVKKVTTFTCPIPQKKYGDMLLLNIGKDVSLPDVTYIPQNLVKMSTSSSTKDICLIKEAKEYFELMVSDAKRENLNIKASSGFRDYNYQKTLFDNAIKNGNDDVDVSIAKAGYSEHQLGTAVDITSSSINYDSASGNFYKTAESDWLKENAYLYGFIQSYPLGKEDITGYKSEPWHYRYVGIENAKEIKDADLTITEFLK